MHPTAKKCVVWAVCLFLLGALAMAWTTDLYLLIADRMGANAQVGLALLPTVLSGERWSLFPTGAALVARRQIRVNDIRNIGEIASLLAVAIERNGLAFVGGANKPVERHVWALPGSIHGEKTKRD